jgi:hypothetical protein
MRIERSRKFWVHVIIVALAFSATPVIAQTGGAPAAAQPHVTPTQGQSAAQQQKDLSECYNIAKEKTGIDPQMLGNLMPGNSSGAAAGQAGAQAPAQSGQNSAGGVMGAAAGAMGQSAPSAGAKGTKASKINTFQMANQGCLQARGYLVKGGQAATQPAAQPAAPPHP